MPWSGGAFTRTNGVHTGSTLWVQDRDAGTKILAARHDTHDQDLAGGINSTLEKSGSNAATGNLNIGSNRLTAVADGTAKTDAATVNQLQSNAPAFQATDTGTANAHVIALSPAITAYAAGQAITFKSNNASTTTSTVNVNGLGVKTIKKKHDKNIEAGDIEDGSIVTVVYDGTNFQMTSQAATDDGLDLGAVSGIIEANANFVDMCLVGPSVDGMSWNGHFSKASVWTSLMLATVETSGSDAQVNIWDLASNVLASATPLATLTLSGATPTSIAASMGYLIVGTSDQGFHIVHPHTGAWAECTEGPLKTLSTSTAPTLADNNVFDVAIQMPDTGSPYDPNTGGLVPFISWTYGASADECGILNNNVVYNKTEGTATDNVTAIDAFGHVYTTNNSSDYGRKSDVPIYQILADDWGTSIFFDGSGGAGPTFTGAQGDANSISLGPDGKIVTATDAGLNYGYTHGSRPGSAFGGYVTRTFTTGYLGQSCVLSALANSDTADRSGNSHTLTKNGTITEAVVASGAELKAYSGWSSSNNLDLDDGAFDVGTSGFSLFCWIKTTSTSEEMVVDYAQADLSGARFYFELVSGSTNVGRFFVSSGSYSITVNGTSHLGDGEWHLVSMTFDGVSKTGKLYVDGILEGTATNTDIGSVTNTSAVLHIGVAANGSSVPWGGSLSLLRFMASSAFVSESYMLRMYRDERPLYLANAKCLLQSGSTDIVLDAAVDPLTGKFIVTQTDSQEIFNGLAIETERTVATGGSTFEHGLLWGDAVAEINNANLFASTPATDQRQVNEMVRSLSADLPAGIDLGKAKAWAIYDQGTGITLSASYNIESIADTATGRSTITFAVPFKTAEYAVAGSADAANVFAVNNTNMKAGSAEVYVTNYAGSVVDSNRISAIFFGELENE